MDAIASSVAGTNPDRQAKLVQANALKAQEDKRSATATVELVDAASAADQVDQNRQPPINHHQKADSGKGHLLNIVA